MKKSAAFCSALLIAALNAQVAPAAPQFPAGLWRVADGTAIIRIKPCGKSICGFVAAAPKPAPGERSAVGQKILINLQRDGNSWKGPIYNLDNGKTYAGELSPGTDLDHLKIRGCLPGGGLCGGETWKRAR